MSVGRSGAGWQHVDCSCCSLLWSISPLACSHRWHCSLQISLEGCDSHYLRLIAVYLFNHQLQKWVGPLTLHLDPASVSAISTGGNIAAPTGAQGQPGGRGSVGSPALTPPYCVTPRDTPGGAQGTLAAAPGASQSGDHFCPSWLPSEPQPALPRLWHHKTKNSETVSNRFFPK